MNQIFQTKNHLHFGAIIYISCLYQDAKFYMYSNGISFKAVLSIAQNQSPYNPSSCLFVVKPTMKFQSEDLVSSILHNKYNQQIDGFDYQEKKAKALVDQFEFQLKQNIKLKQQQKNYPLKYNESFMLQHVFSSNYLLFKKSADSNQFSLELTQVPSSSCVFSLKACFNYQKDVNTYIPFNSASYLNVKFQQGLHIREMNLNFISNSLFDSWMFSQENQDKIRIELYQTGQEVEYKNICYGDTVWVFHLESGSFVKVVDQDRSQNSIILKKIKYTLGYSNDYEKNNQQQKEKEAKSKIMIQKAQNQMSAEKFGLWQIIPVLKKDKNQLDKGKFLGGKVKFDDQVRFLNSKYKAYLSVRKIKKGRNKFQFQYAIQQTQQQNTVFQIKNLSSSSAYVTTQDLFLIKNVTSNTYLTLSVPFAVNQTQAFLTPSLSYKKQDNFKFTKIDFIQLWQNNYLLSTMPYITEGIRALESIKDGLISSRDQVMLRIMCENLIEILAFSFDLTEGFEASQSKLGKLTYNHFQVQKLLKEQQVISKLISALKLINPNILIDNIKQKKKSSLKMSGLLNIIKKYGVGTKNAVQSLRKVDAELIQKIVNTSLKILRNGCKSNTQNALLLFQNSKVIIKFLSLGTYAEDFIIDSFSNSIILQKLTTQNYKQIIQQYIKIYQVTKIQTQKIFTLLSKLILFEGSGIGRNQLQVYRLFFYKENPLMISLQEVGNRFYVNNLELNQFCQTYPQVANILGYQIKFFAQLTADRNYICSKTIKEWFPLPAILNYLINKPINNFKVKESFVWMIIHIYLNSRPRFKRSIPLVFTVPYDNKTKRQHQQISNFQIQMKVMKDEGLSKAIIEDIFSCIHQNDEMSEKDLNQIKKFIVSKVQKFSDSQIQIQKFYSSKTQAYLTCLKYLIQLSVFQQKQTEDIRGLLKKIAKKIDQSLNLRKGNIQKLQSTNFRQLLLQMLQKNVIKKFNYSANFDGVEDEICQDNICFIFINYSFYQNILLSQKDLKARKEADSAIKTVFQLLQVYGEIKKGNKIKKFVAEITKQQNIKAQYNNKDKLIKQIVINNILETQQNKTDIFKLLTLLFYNSNTYNINSMSLNILLNQIFADRLAMEQLTKLQFNVDQKQIEQFQTIQETCKNIKSLIQTSQIWLNTYQVSHRSQSKYDTVTHLFVNKLKKLIKLTMPNLDQQCNQSFYCYKYSNSILAQKQQILANLKIHEQIILFISDYRQLMLKIKVNTITNYNNLLVHVFKYCFLFLYIFIYDSPENKRIIQSTIKQTYLRDFCKYVDKIDFGQGMLVTQYLKNNYEESIQFYNKNNQIFQKYHKYTATHSKLLITILNFYNQPIQINLKKFYVTIFDLRDFKNFLWLKPNGVQFNLQIQQFDKQINKQPYLYHIHALQVILKLVTHLQQTRNTIKQHIKKSLTQQYLFGLLTKDDFYIKENSNNSLLKIMIHFKAKIMKLIQFAYFTDQVKNDTLILEQFRRQNQLLIKFINEAAARQQNEDFRKIFLVRDMKQNPQNRKIAQIYQNFLNYNRQQHVLQVYLNSIKQFCLTYKQMHQRSTDSMTQKMVIAAEDIHSRVNSVYEILHKRSKCQNQNSDSVDKYIVPYQWLFTLSSSFKDQDSVALKKYFNSFLMQSIFSKQIFAKFRKNEKAHIKTFLQTLENINLKQFLFLRKISEYLEDAFQKLSNGPTPQMYKSTNLLIRFLTLWLQCSTDINASQLRNQIGKSQLIFPILNFFEVCPFDKQNKSLFLACLQFFNQLIGEDGNRSVQTIFNQYFTNKSDSIEVFLKIKKLFDTINYEERANYKCKKIYDSIQTLERDSKLENEAEFIILNFFIRLCKGNFRDNQIFLSSLDSKSNFNIMSGIWQILKHQAQRYKKNLINVQNYHLIIQCFSTVRELVEGPCIQNQNQFLKRDFFLTVLQYFQFQIADVDLSLQKVLEQKLKQIQKISPKFTQTLRIYLNRDKITQKWIPSQVKYRCISLICSLLSQNVNQQSRSQLYTIDVNIIIKQLDKIYQRYVDLGLQYRQQNLQVKQNTQIVLPLGFKLYELLQYFPPEKLPEHSPGLDFFRANSRVVEVMHQKLCVVIFPRIPDQISDAFKARFIQQVDRSSINSKLKGLQDAEVQNKQSDYPYGYIILVLALIITILDIIIYNANNLPYVQFFSFFPIFRMYDSAVIEQGVSTACILIIIVLSLIFLFLQAKGAKYFREYITKIWDSDLTNFQKFIKILKFTYENLTYFYYLFTLLLGILTIYNPFFDAILLLAQLNRRSDTFSAIIDAIKATLDQLLVVLLFMLICTYVLTTFLYYYRATTAYSAQCSTLYNCFVFSLDLGIRADAGIAGYNDNNPDSVVDIFANYPIEDVLVNFLYLFIIKMVIDQIIGAIIIDKFAALRESKQKIEQDEQSLCFICGLDRTLLDREQDGFDVHKELYHNVWNYFQFLIYLRNAKLSSLSGIELFVFDQQKNGKLNWFPINRSYHMEQKNKQANDRQQVEDELQKLMKTLDLEINQLSNQTTQIWNLLNVKLAKQQNKH